MVKGALFAAYTNRNEKTRVLGVCEAYLPHFLYVLVFILIQPLSHLIVDAVLKLLSFALSYSAAYFCTTDLSTLQIIRSGYREAGRKTF